LNVAILNLLALREDHVNTGLPHENSTRVSHTPERSSHHESETTLYWRNPYEERGYSASIMEAWNGSGWMGLTGLVKGRQGCTVARPCNTPAPRNEFVRKSSGRVHTLVFEGFQVD
jgi:hypothetical protein